MITARYIASCVLGALVVAAILLSFGAAPAPTSAFAPPDAGIVAVPDAVTPAAGSGSARPSDEIADPIDDPIGAIADARDAKRQGWPVFALVAVIMLSRGLGTAHRRWPASRWLAWFGGKPALVTGGVSVVAVAAFDALVLSGSWWAALIAAAGALLMLVSPEPKQPEPAREPQPSAVGLGGPYR